MGVLNFAHGVFLTARRTPLWFTEQIGGSAEVEAPDRGAFGLVVGALLGALAELILIRPLYGRHIEQVLVTVGLALALRALVDGIWGADAHVLRRSPLDAWRRRRSSARTSPTTAGSR